MTFHDRHCFSFSGSCFLDKTEGMKAKENPTSVWMQDVHCCIAYATVLSLLLSVMTNWKCQAGEGGKNRTGNLP